MFNLWWGIAFMIVQFLLWLACYRLFGKTGLYAWVGFATVLANIQVVKTIELFGIVMTLGNTIYTSIYMSTDLLNEKYGQQEAKKAVWFGFFSLIAATLVMQMTIRFVPQPEDFSQESLQTIFGLTPRLAAGSLCAYFVSQFLDVRVYGRLRDRFPVYNQFWIRTNGSTGLSQLVDSLVFCTIAFAGVHSTDIWLQILITTYALKLIISIASTPVLYAARSFKLGEDKSRPSAA